MAGTAPQLPHDNSGVDVTTEFVRHRNALLARASLANLYLDYYLHLADCGIQVADTHDKPFKQMIAAFILHCASRPRNEMIAWTVNLQHPLLNMFATADNELGTAIGRVFTQNVREGEHNLFYVETVKGLDPLRRSVVTFDTPDIFAAAETFYTESEQRPARLFDLGDENFALLVAHPDCDVDWLHNVTAADIAALADHETLVKMEQRRYDWTCGCSEKRILNVLAPSMRDDPDGLFGDEDAIATECPRCGVLYRISREALEAYVAENPK